MATQTISAPIVGHLRLERCLFNYFSTMLFIALGIAFYTVFGTYHIGLFSADWRPELFGWKAIQVWKFSDVLVMVAYIYALALIPYYWYSPERISKAAYLIRWAFGGTALRAEIRGQVKQALLSLLLKFFFIPFCINGLLGHFAILNNGILTATDTAGRHLDPLYLYATVWHPLAMNLILVFDFVPFVIGYMVESDTLNNTVISVETTLSGWLVCLACYPPFNDSVGRFIPWATRDFVPYALLGNHAAFFLLNGLLLLLFAAYASASVSLGFKCCNLCNRGVVSTGLYRYVRHPAYLLKNLAWWVAAIPVLIPMFSHSVGHGLFGCLSLSAWSAIYAARAITEERHLLRTGDAYLSYMQEVRWRFIPHVL